MPASTTSAHTEHPIALRLRCCTRGLLSGGPAARVRRFCGADRSVLTGNYEWVQGVRCPIKVPITSIAAGGFVEMGEAGAGEAIVQNPAVALVGILLKEASESVCVGVAPANTEWMACRVGVHPMPLEG